MVDPPFSPGPQRLSQIFMSGESKPWFQPEEHGRCCKTAAHEHHEERKRPPTEAALLLSRGGKPGDESHSFMWMRSLYIVLFFLDAAVTIVGYRGSIIGTPR
jgi:hypothetical protein